MAKRRDELVDGELRGYRLPFAAKAGGRYVLMCGKCQRKVRKSGGLRLKKALKRVGKGDPEGAPVRVVQIPCLKMCPKGGITVCTQGQWGRSECSMVRTEAGVVALYRLCQGEQAGKDFVQIVNRG